MKWPKFLTYGNWGGAGWSSGKFTDNKAEVDWNITGIDAMDVAFKIHDYGYQYGISRKDADLILVKTLVETNVRGTWPNIYRYAAIGIFFLKSFFEK
jgi:hypothetical protein